VPKKAILVVHSLSDNQKMLRVSQLWDKNCKIKINISKM